jgi:FlaA1/EpsC-like NDP-sugar epimerase
VFRFFVDLASRHRFLFNLVVHNLLFTAALAMACLIGFDIRSMGIQKERVPWFSVYFLPSLPFILVGKSIIFGQFKLFRGWWQYASIRDILYILAASWVFLASAFAAVFVFVYLPMYLNRVPLFAYSRGVLLLDFMATVFLVCTARLGVRLWHEERRPMSDEGVRRVLVIGAGKSAETLLREINRMEVERYRVVGLLDDDESKVGAYLHGIPVLGSTDEIRQVCQERKVDEILIAMPSSSQKQLRRIIELCQGTQLHFQSLPSMDALIDGRVTVSQVRQVKIEDLLGREAVELDRQAVGRFLHGRRVLITGAGGSIGSEMCRQACTWQPQRLVLVEQAENNLFDISNELARDFPAIDLVSVICDIYDRQRVLNVFMTHRPEVVIHAAAHKHVPLMELNPCEAVKNNIFGTRNVADACCAAGVDEFVFISTDKAVNPSSIMGCTKRVAEIYIQSLNGREGCATKFKAVRFGNVLGSAGSVVPTFERQIRQGGPVTVTHPDMTRYFMTIPEAAQLVLQAAAAGEGGQVFLLDMGEPVKIVDLARDMITLSGLRVGEDIDIVFTSLRPGEKLFEELKTEGEDIAPTVHPKVKIWKHRPVSWEKIQLSLEELAGLTQCAEHAPVVQALQRLVPEYKPLNTPASLQAPSESHGPVGEVGAGAQLPIGN